MRNNNLIISVALLLFVFNSCNNLPLNDTQGAKNNDDSIKITNVIKDVYKWYSKEGSQVYFDIIVKDSFQIGLDTMKLITSLDKLKSTNYFSSDFINNYEKIGKAVDDKLHTGKYYNEINFNFQDADVWTSSQDDEWDLWKNLKIKDLIINGDYATFKWYTDNRDYGYLVKMKKENDIWKVSYLEGLDYKNTIE
jgi:hypothetical protein